MSPGRFFVLLFERIRSNRWLQFFAAATALFFLYFVVSTPFSLGDQVMFGGLLFAVAFYVGQYKNHYINMLLILLSLIASFRYMYWRISGSISFESNLQFALALLLLAAELYAFLILLLGYFQTAWPLDRLPKKMPDDCRKWPDVDIYIPTYNEGLDVVRPTVMAALNLEWPANKLHVYVLDDGNRQEFSDFCATLGVRHMTRDDNLHAKAGNINAALPKTGGEFVAIFDCDHVPARTFLLVNMGLLVADDNLALVQTPHHFFTPDPFERNLEIFRKVPNEGELFYGLVQPGNDFWNAAFFCGSCAIIRRSMMLEVGGIAIETVTEDAHTALKMHALGYDSAYIGIPQAAGLATESISGHIGQRTRWGRGMAQIMRVDMPLFKKGLKFPQRLCYFNGMLHFFYGLPRMVFLTAPLGYLFFDVHIINASALMIAAMVLPHLAHAMLTTARVQGKFRHTFWAEVYETVMAPYLLIPTTLALINPKIGSFNVTAKGGIIKEEYFDIRMAMPLIILFVLNVLGALVGIVSLISDADSSAGTLIFNLVWTAYNLTIISCAGAVCLELKQLRDHQRIPMDVPIMIRFDSGRTIHSHSIDISEGGLSFSLASTSSCQKGETVSVSLLVDEEAHTFDGNVVFVGQNKCSVQFDEMEQERYVGLVAIMFGRPNAWVHWADDRIEDHPFRSFKLIVNKSLSGFAAIFRLLLLLRRGEVN